MIHRVSWFIRYDTVSLIGRSSRRHSASKSSNDPYIRQRCSVLHIFFILLVRFSSRPTQQKKTSRSPVDGSGPWFPDVTIFTNRIKKIVNFLKIITFLKIVIIIGTDKIIGMMIHCLWRHRSCRDHPAVSSFAFQVRTN